jgi:hypothetical protein
MKTISKSILVSATFLLFGIVSLKAQSICMVTADFELAESYIVVWEKPLDISGIDSVLIYRKQGNESDFTRIGARSMQDDYSFFTDVNANTIVNTWYRISYLDSDGNESDLSPWHRPVVMDYLAGLLVWTEYEKEDQLDETWINGYACMRDETGLGLFGTMGYWETAAGNTQTEWFDQEAASFNNYYYQMIVDLPSCDISRANINTSRSNIKRQSPNSEANINELEQLIAFTISPNPTTDQLTIVADKMLIGSDYKVSSSNGQLVAMGTLTNEVSTINLNHLTKGNYFFHIHNNGKNFSRLFIKN